MQGQTTRDREFRNCDSGVARIDKEAPAEAGAKSRARFLIESPFGSRSFVLMERSGRTIDECELSRINTVFYVASHVS